MNDAAINAWLKGRLSRKNYIVATLIYLMAFAVVSWFPLTAPYAPFVAPWIWVVGIASRRFHDFGKSGWWALLPFGLGFAQALVTGLIGAVEPAAAGAFRSVAPLVVGAFTLGFMIWLGIRRGDLGANRFGPAPNTLAPEEHFT